MRFNFRRNMLREILEEFETGSYIATITMIAPEGKLVAKNFPKPSEPKIQGFELYDYGIDASKKYKKPFAIFYCICKDRREAVKVINKAWDGTGDFYKKKYGMRLLTQDMWRISAVTENSYLSNTKVSAKDILDSI